LRLSVKAKIRKQVNFLRKATGSTDIEKTMKKAVETLAAGNIPCLVAGGMAVQENGYPRMTVDVDLIVPDVAKAREYLSIRGFRPNPGSSMTDKETKVEIDLLPGNGSVGPGPLKLPMPTEVSKEPKILSLEQLIAIKLSSYLGNKISRAKDLGDVVELIKARKPSRDLKLPTEVKEEYLRVWDALKEEQK
jgi:hypothetical protein